jgi:hypothetical protein
MSVGEHLSETEGEPQCRFCLETDKQLNLIAPCSCKGTNKYVHNACLLRWVSAEPERGLKCSACLEEFAQDVRVVREKIEEFPSFLYFVYNRPFIAILCAHWLYLAVLYNSLVHSLLSHETMYSLFQTGLHILAFNEISLLVNQVKNKEMYRNEWKKAPRFLLPFVHSTCLCIIPETKWIGGMASNICLYYYFFEHVDILEQINQSIKISFRNRSLEQTPS